MTTADVGARIGARGRAASRCWIWPYRPSRRVAGGVYRLAAEWGGLYDRRWWPLLCLAIGAGPAWCGYAWGLPGAHLVAALLTLPPLLGACVRDDLARGLAALALVVIGTCGLNVTLAALDPAGLAAALPSGALYWEESRTWIVTGENPEYELSSWAPAHARLLGGVGLLGYVSLGVTPLRFGLEQVDMMNFYVGRLAASSQSPVLAVLLGWHPWSVCRGIGCLLLIFEAASCSLERLTGRALSTRRRRLSRWGAGIGFLLLDGIVKYLCMEPVRSVLAENLIS